MASENFTSITTDFNELFNVSLQIRANTERLFKIVVNDGILCSCNVESNIGKRFFSDISLSKDSDKMVISTVDVKQCDDVSLLDCVHENSIKRDDHLSHETYNEVSSLYSDTGGFEEEGEESSQKGMPHSPLKCVDQIGTPTELSKEMKIGVHLKSTGSQKFKKRHMKKKGKKELQLVLKAKENSKYYFKSEINSVKKKRNKVKATRFSDVKFRLKKLALEVSQKLKEEGTIAKDLSTQANIAVFFKKVSDFSEEAEQCLLCGELFSSGCHSEAEFHLFHKHSKEYESLHKHAFSFENYLEERNGCIDINKRKNLNEKTNSVDESSYCNEEKPSSTVGECDTCSPQANNRRLRKTKSHYLYTCLLCNNGKYVTVQNFLHMKTVHANFFHSHLSVPEARMCNYLVGNSLYQYIEQKKVIFDRESAVFTCTVCSVKLDTRRSAIRHVRYSHSISNQEINEAPVTCNLCSATFGEEKLLLQHMVDEHKSMRTKWFTCSLCDQRFEAKYELRRHGAEFHNDAFPCPFDGCKVKFYQTIKSFNLHVIKNHLSQVVPVDTYPLPASLNDESNMNLTDITMSHDNEGSTTSVVFPNITNEALQKLDKNCLNELCSVCGQIFTSKSTNGYMVKYKLIRHFENRHQDHIGDVDNVNVFKCCHCDMKFLSVASRNEHEKDTHFDGTCPYSDCGKVFKKRGTLSSHIRRTHAKAGIAQCQICGKELCDKIQLQLHINSVHEKRRDFVCKYAGCGKSFSRKSNLTVHVRIHTGEKPLKCNYCDFRGRQRNNITAHIKAHHADKLGNITKTIPLSY